MVGLPGTTVEGTKSTFAYLDKEGVRVRPSIYSDYSLLRPEMTEQEATHVLSRHFLPDGVGFTSDEQMELYKLVFGLNTVTHVAGQIPTRS